MNPIFKENQSFFILSIIIFTITGFLDLYLDNLFGVSLTHTILQIVLYLVLFIITHIIFNFYHKTKFNILLTEDLINFLNIIKEAETKNTVLNQKKFLSILNITKPTLKKKIKILINLNYVESEQKGNYKYLKLTSLGKSIIK